MKRSPVLVALGAVCAANAEDPRRQRRPSAQGHELERQPRRLPVQRPVGATLNSVTVKFHGAVKGSVWLENMNSVARDFSASA